MVHMGPPHPLQKHFVGSRWSWWKGWLLPSVTVCCCLTMLPVDRCCSVALCRSTEIHAWGRDFVMTGGDGSGTRWVGHRSKSRSQNGETHLSMTLGCLLSGCTTDTSCGEKNTDKQWETLRSLLVPLPDCCRDQGWLSQSRHSHHSATLQPELGPRVGKLLTARVGLRLVFLREAASVSKTFWVGCKGIMREFKVMKKNGAQTNSPEPEKRKILMIFIFSRNLDPKPEGLGWDISPGSETCKQLISQSVLNQDLCTGHPYWYWITCTLDLNSVLIPIWHVLRISSFPLQN